ncbi:MAG: division/cell wall cluster transcriptional repressor MraZ [Mangrovicoccus sp.]
MGRRFRSEYWQKVDGKGRVSIPANFRRVLETCDPDWVEGKAANLVIVFGDTRRQFLEGYTMEELAEIDEKISRIPRGTPQRAYMQKLFYTLSEELSVDHTGRLVLPKTLRQKLRLDGEGEVVFAGCGGTFQIWNPQDYEAQNAVQDGAAFEGLPEDADPLLILEQFN